MTLILLLLLPLATGLICVPVRSRRRLELLNLAGFAGVALLAGLLAYRVVHDGPVSALNGFLYADALSALVVGLTAFVALVCSIYAVGYFRQDERAGKATPRQLRRYYRLTPLFVFAMLLVALANNLGVMWVAIEGTTLASVLLIAFYNERGSLEAAWKYIIIGSVGLSLALFGTILTYYAAADALGGETSKGLNWSVLVTRAANFKPDAMRLAFMMALLGYGTKAGLAPMHTWKPDAYAEAPVPASALLGAGVINCALYAIIRFYVLSAKCLGHDFSGRYLLGFGLASMVVAVPFILVQRNFRRLLAYSSIEHAGIMVTAIGFGARLAVLGALLHMVFHAVTKPLLFFCAGNVQQQFGTPFTRKVRGAIRVMPMTGALFLMVMLAVTGVPPFSIFQSEFAILSGALAANHGWLAALFITCVVAIFAGFLNHISRMTLGTPREEMSRPAACPWKMTAMLSLTVVIVGLGFWLPAPLFELVEQTAHIIGGIHDGRFFNGTETADAAKGCQSARQRLECGDLSPLLAGDLSPSSRCGVCGRWTRTARRQVARRKSGENSPHSKRFPPSIVADPWSDSISFRAMNTLPDLQPILDDLARRFGPEIEETRTFNENEVYLHTKMEFVPGLCGYFYRKQAGRLVSVFAEDERERSGCYFVRYVFAVASARAFFIVRIPVAPDQPEFTSLTNAVHAVNWQEREIQDLFGLKLIGHPNPRRCALHDDWPEVFPLRRDFDLRATLPPFTGERHKFRAVEGEGVFQVPVGPVHAGIIEPGHFLFSVAGEPVLYLQIRLFYTHKGTEKLFENIPVMHGVRLAESVSGDSSFAHAAAFCHAVERAAQAVVPPRARALRTICLELERLYNHIADIGAIATDVAFVVANAHAMRLKERVLRLNEHLTGNRLLRGMASVGGVRYDWDAERVSAIARLLDWLAPEFESLVELLQASASTRDRLEGTGILTPETAHDLGVVGLAGRASGFNHDLRRDFPHAAYDQVKFAVPVYTEGDVLHRMQVRIEEVRQSLEIIRQLVANLPAGDVRVRVDELPANRVALGYVEGWRGEIFHWIRTLPGNRLARCKIKDPSLQNWPALSEAILGNIIPDFPVINKSFNLSYSGTDR